MATFTPPSGRQNLSRAIRFCAILISFLLLCCATTAFADFQIAVTNQWWSEASAKSISQSGTNQAEIVQALRDVPKSQRPGLQFLVENMPRQDLQSLSAAFLLENVAQAYESRDKAPWGKTIPDELFFNYVLPYANINEQREAWRKSLYEKCAPLVKDCKTPGEAAQRLNEKLFPLVKVKYSTQRKKADQSPSESIESGLASCTGLSILLIDACRSVGIPARLVGIPNWADNRGNHTWVEVWDTSWHFTGAAEPDPKGLDHTWFEADAAQATRDSKEHAIYATSFKKTDLPFPLVWAPDLDYISAINVTDNYTPKSKLKHIDKTRLLVKVLDRPAGNRITSKICITDPNDSAVHFEGTSRDEKFDSNDMLAFELLQSHTYKIQVQAGKHTLNHEFATSTNSQQMLVLDLAETATAFTIVTPQLKPKDQAKLKSALTDFFNASLEKQSGWKFDHSLETLLQKNEPAVRQIAWEAYRNADIHQDLKHDYEAKQVRFQKYLSPYTVKYVGQKPAHGWPLFIAMHGGGGTAKEVNDSQWKMMQGYYHDQSSVPGYIYVALRAPNDEWNGFYDDYVYPLVNNLIHQFLIFGETDPNKVFIMGYSHGGYGAFAIGPKMPDHFAAIHASAAAPTDGETSAKTLRNTPFAFMIGEKDDAYGRIERCRAFNETVKKLRGERTDIYPVTMEYQPGYGHGGLPDKDKIKDMYPFIRNPVPTELNWELTDGVIKNFFWLQVPQPAKKQEIQAACHNNRIVVTTTNITVASLLLDGRLIDFSRPVTVELNGHSSTCKLQPSLLTLCESLLERADCDLAFSTKMKLEF
ncbi:transglutaminase domain-containing protein [Pedosphaera parvula]|uniref:Transglutaminase domain protein n=1 Tax=Pedosphaera parvula (strain Ellin514) TaxID=320771 RepID=B9XC44_PEDPL|nr:transglutaminase domain-containing protein [Pedosphaera parvula]EEF62512.1 transglutaminase domain protein [Pedosphaera parvula Ellin514]